MALNAQFAATPKFGSALLTTADSILTGTPTNASPSIITGAVLGTRISKIIAKATSSDGTLACVVRYWLFDGTNHRLFHEVLLPPNTQSVTNPAASVILSESTNFDILPFVLMSGHSIRASISQTQTVTVSIFGADL